MILLWRHNALTEQVLSPIPLGVPYGLWQKHADPIHLSLPPRSPIPLTPTSQLVKQFASTNIPRLHTCSKSSTFLSPVSFSRHDTVATFLSRFMHRFPRILMNARFMLILSPFVTRYLLHPSLSFSRFSSSSLRIRSPLPPLYTLSVPLYPLFIRRFFVRSRSVHVYIYIDPHASNLSLSFRVFVRCFPSALNISSFPPHFMCHVCVRL